MLVLINKSRRRLATRRDAHSEQFVSEETGLACSFVTGLGARGKEVRLLTTYTKIRSDVIAGLGHGVIAILGSDFRIGKARADGAVNYGEIATVGSLSLGHD